MLLAFGDCAKSQKEQIVNFRNMTFVAAIFIVNTLSATPSEQPGLECLNQVRTDITNGYNLMESIGDDIAPEGGWSDGKDRNQFLKLAKAAMADKPNFSPWDLEIKVYEQVNVYSDGQRPCQPHLSMAEMPARLVSVRIVFTSTQDTRHAYQVEFFAKITNQGNVHYKSAPIVTETEIFNQ